MHWKTEVLTIRTTNRDDFAIRPIERPATRLFQLNAEHRIKLNYRTRIYL